MEHSEDNIGITDTGTVSTGTPIDLEPDEAFLAASIAEVLQLQRDIVQGKPFPHRGPSGKVVMREPSLAASGCRVLPCQ
jgi:hypothetical protein